MSQDERTRFRDLALNDRHRLWGRDCPATDVDDFLEYNHGKSAGLVEYKNHRAQPTGDYNRLAFVDLAGRADLPAFEARYGDDFGEWEVTPLNAQARLYLPQNMKMTEARWVRLLYRVRGYDGVPADVLRILHG